VLWRLWPDGDQVGTAAAPWGYDAAARLASIPGHISSLAYNARGQVTQATYANGVTTTNSYSDARGWLTGVSTSELRGHDLNCINVQRG
jgi:YD repeat-containing protein